MRRPFCAIENYRVDPSGLGEKSSDPQRGMSRISRSGRKSRGRRSEGYFKGFRGEVVTGRGLDVLYRIGRLDCNVVVGSSVGEVEVGGWKLEVGS